jgi:hypothetical protein
MTLPQCGRMPVVRKQLGVSAHARLPCWATGPGGMGSQPEDEQFCNSFSALLANFAFENGRFPRIPPLT